MADVPVFRRDEVPEYLMTNQQLRVAGRRAGDPRRPDGYVLVELFDARFRDDEFVEKFDRRAVDRQRAALWAQEVLDDPNTVLLDTESTDFDGRVLEIAVVSPTGEVLLESLVNPEGEPIVAEAAAKHGITAEMVSAPGVPMFADVHDELVELLSGKRVVCWKTAFDRELLTAEANRLLPSWSRAAETDWVPARWDDAMARHAEWVGEPAPDGSGYRRHRLDGEHRALGDCITMLARLHEMATNPEPLPPEPKAGTWSTADDDELTRMDYARLTRIRSRHAPAGRRPRSGGGCSSWGWPRSRSTSSASAPRPGQRRPTPSKTCGGFIPTRTSAGRRRRNSGWPIAIATARPWRSWWLSLVATRTASPAGWTCWASPSRRPKRPPCRRRRPSDRSLRAESSL
ncbi:3'-5' exonuclease [Amycolatopsis sp. OK19-0408]|uniref:3'-5' exonuclease n=1 Tax=Amycolatopsis iheyensis TaxID=2945988 RepID=A0A9X2NKQ5_9PSEU|nr:3'-5' exonuclease [Amycolatopsis iheyensis]MCR6488359.1 3'-5' exonuclease [Amycolatopsis iheyensis]